MWASIVLLSVVTLGQSPDDTAPAASPPSIDAKIPAANKQRSELKTRVAKLVRRLDADSRADRDQAEEDLIKLGPDVIGFLPSDEASANLTADQRERLTQIRGKLENARAESFFNQTTVTLHGQTTMAKAVAAIHEQTGNTVVPAAGDNDAEFDVQFDKTPFFRTVEALCDRSKCSIYPYGSPDAITLQPSLPNSLPVTDRAVLIGPLRIEPTRVVASRDLRKADEASLVVHLEVAWEPRLHPIGLKQLQSTIKAVDEKDRPLEVINPQAEQEAFARVAASAVSMEVPLKIPKDSARRIGHLQGTIRLAIPNSPESFRFTDLTKKSAQSQRIASAKVTVDEVRQNGETWEVSVHVAFDDAGDSLDSHKNWILLNPAFLVGADAKEIPYDSMETTDRDKSSVGLTYLFALKDLPEKAVFVYKTPTMIVTRDFNYDLKDIRLP